MAQTIKTRSPQAAKQRQLLEVRDLTGGVDLRRSPTLLAPNRARTLKNYSLEEPGALVVRPGYLRASTGSLGTGRAQGGQRVYLANAVFSLLAWNGEVYRPTDAWVFGAAVYSTISTANQVYFPYDRDLVMVMDGANRPRFSTNGSTWMSLGINAPSTGPTLSSVNISTATLTTGEYEVAFSYKHRGTAYEGNVSTGSTITMTASSANAISGSIPASTDPKVDAARYYARHKTPDLESVLRYVSSGAVGSSFTITSSNWTSNDEAPTNHDVPVAVQFGVFWKNRCWAPDASVGNRLRFTELFLSQAWPTNFYIDIPFEKGDSITAVQSLGDTLLVFGDSGIFLIIGQTSLDFEVRPSQGADAGAVGPRAVMKIEQSVTHASHDGVDSFDGGTDRSLEHDIQVAWSDLVTETASSGLALIAAVYDHERQEGRLAVPRVYPTGTKGEWILNLARTSENDGVPAWTTTDRDIAFYMHWEGAETTAGNHGRLFSMPSTSGVVYEEKTGVTANSSNMTAEYEGPGISMGLHRARVVGTHCEVEPHGGAFSIELLTDGVSQGNISMSIGTGLFLYGSGTYGTATYGGAGRIKPYTNQPLAADGHVATLKTVYVGQEAFKHFTYAHVIVPEVEPRRIS